MESRVRNALTSSLHRAPAPAPPDATQNSFYILLTLTRIAFVVSKVRRILRGDKSFYHNFLFENDVRIICVCGLSAKKYDNLFLKNTKNKTVKKQRYFKTVLLNLFYSAAHVLPRICLGTHFYREFSSELRDRHNCEQQNYKKQ